MVTKQFTHAIALGTLVLIAAGCGGGGDDQPAGGTVITPSAQSSSDSAADDTDSAEPSGDSTASATPTPSETPEPVTKPAAETTTAAVETPEPEPAAPAAATGEGTTFKGRVVVAGTPPTISKIKPSGNDAFCINLGEIENDEVRIGEGNGLADVFVWVRKVPSGVDSPAPPEEPSVLDQKGCRFIPPALIVQVGQTLLVKNADATLHNTRMSGLAINFNQTVAPNNRDGVPVEINRPEIVPVPVKCDIHGWMSARVLATDNPWNAVTDKDGFFEIGNLPSGVELEFRLQHGKAGYVEKSLKLTLGDGEVKEQNFEVDAAKLSD
jgi:hypothetical protein